MAVIRIFLLTHRRPVLLRRALASLRAQTFTDWVCELHNDAPDDDSPRRILAEIQPPDPRITLHQHAQNLGPVTTFNHAFAGISPEPFVSILEDDNWWEPDFLATARAALVNFPQVAVAWANMYLWQEEADGGWRDTGFCIWPVVPTPAVTIAWPQLMQCDGPLHSNGALLVRREALAAGRLCIPGTLPFEGMENLRERSLPHPLLLLTRPLANFALTRTTARAGSHHEWLGLQILMAIAFLEHAKPSPADAARLWRARRQACPPATSVLFFAAFLSRHFRFLGHATMHDWLRFLTGMLRHPHLAWAAFNSRRRHPDHARLFADSTARACTAPQGSADLPPFALACSGDLPVALAARRPQTPA